MNAFVRHICEFTQSWLLQVTHSREFHPQLIRGVLVNW